MADLTTEQFLEATRALEEVSQSNYYSIMVPKGFRHRYGVRRYIGQGRWKSFWRALIRHKVL